MDFSNRQGWTELSLTSIGYWIDCWPAARLEFFSDTSDHKGIMDLVTFSQAEKGRKPFRLFNSWPEDPKFLSILRAGLSKQIRGAGLFKVNGEVESSQVPYQGMD